MDESVWLEHCTHLSNRRTKDPRYFGFICETHQVKVEETSSGLLLTGDPDSTRFQYILFLFQQTFQYNMYVLCSYDMDAL